MRIKTTRDVITRHIWIFITSTS